MPTCKICGKRAESDYCFRHKPRKRMKVSVKKKDESLPSMRELFLSIWRKRPHYSEVSREWLGSEPLHTLFHHILYTEMYPQAAYDEENIILLTLDEHTNCHNGVAVYEEIEKRKKKLMVKYGIH